VKIGRDWPQGTPTHKAASTRHPHTCLTLNTAFSGIFSGGVAVGLGVGGRRRHATVYMCTCVEEPNPGQHRQGRAGSTTDAGGRELVTDRRITSARATRVNFFLRLTPSGLDQQRENISERAEMSLVYLDKLQFCIHNLEDVFYPPEGDFSPLNGAKGAPKPEKLMAEVQRFRAGRFRLGRWTSQRITEPRWLKVSL
jgi:hypothetical protein